MRRGEWLSRLLVAGLLFIIGCVLAIAAFLDWLLPDE